MAENAPSTPAPIAPPAVTAKARKLAAELGIDIADVSAAGGRIGEAEVRAAAERSRPAPATNGTTQRWRAEAPRGRRAVIVGGGGHAACLIDALGSAGYDVVGCVDARLPTGTPVSGGTAVIGDEQLLEELLADGVAHAFIGVGGADNSQTRRVLFERVSAMGFEIPPVIHPSAIIAADVRVGRGCHVLAGATIGPRTVIGQNVIVNQGSIVCHDCTVHDHVHLTPGSILAGSVTVGPRSVVGMGSTVLLGLTIGADCLIHNGTHLSSDLDDATLVDATGRRHKRPPVAEL